MTESLKTQSIEAVKAFLSWKGRAADPLPTCMELGQEDFASSTDSRNSRNGSSPSRLVMVLSNKKDCYYVVTARGCSCPAATYDHSPCKHQRKYFPQTTQEPAPEPEMSIRDSLPGWIGPDGQKANGPVESI